MLHPPGFHFIMIHDGFLSKKYLDLKKEILAKVGHGGADVCIDTTGIARVIENAYNLTHKDGKTILVGVPSKKIKIYFTKKLFY